jgi:polyadenylate-binding protein
MTAAGAVIVHDLPTTATEDFLRNLFSEIGDVRQNGITLKSRTDRNGRQSSYAFVQFDSRDSAIRAINEMNYTKLDGVPIRIMLADNETKSLLRSGQGNLFVKNLDPTIEDSQLHDAFANFGEIVSCKITKDEHGASQGYGYVQFRNAEDAQQAMEDLKEASINGRPLEIQHFCRRQRRLPEDSFTNVYVKNLPPEFATDAGLRRLFEEFGTVTSPHAVLDQEGRPRGFGFCNMEDHEMAVAAVKGLNGRELGEYTLTCNRAMSRAERQAKIAEDSEKWRRRNAELYKGRNLYVRNFDEDMTEEYLSDLFSQYGQIESVRISRDEAGVSKKFGFVCFTEPEAAQRAIQNSVLLKVGDRSIYVSELVPRTDRKRENLTKINQRNERHAQGPPPPRPDQRIPQPAYRPEGFMTPAPGFPTRQSVAEGMMQMQGAFPYPQQDGVMPGTFGAYQFQQTPPTPKEKVRNEIIERFGQGHSLLKTLGDLSDDQVRRLASDQRLLTEWFGSS